MRKSGAGRGEPVRAYDVIGLTGVKLTDGNGWRLRGERFILLLLPLPQAYLCRSSTDDGIASKAEIGEHCHSGRASHDVART